jgi:hypothetical protein
MNAPIAVNHLGHAESRRDLAKAIPDFPEIAPVMYQPEGSATFANRRGHRASAATTSSGKHTRFTIGQPLEAMSAPAENDARRLAL